MARLSDHPSVVGYHVDLINAHPDPVTNHDASSGGAALVSSIVITTAGQALTTPGALYRKSASGTQTHTIGSLSGFSDFDTIIVANTSTSGNVNVNTADSINGADGNATINPQNFMILIADVTNGVWLGLTGEMPRVSI